MSELALINRGIVPFSRGDMGGRREQATADAVQQGALQMVDGARAKLYELQAAVGDLTEVECPLQHVFAPGAYARTIQIPAGSVVVVLRSPLPNTCPLSIGFQRTAGPEVAGRSQARNYRPCLRLPPVRTTRCRFASTRFTPC